MGPTNSKQYKDIVNTYNEHYRQNIYHHNEHYSKHKDLIRELKEFKHLFEVYKQEHKNEHTEIWDEIRKILDQLERHGISIEDLDNHKTVTPSHDFYEDITKIPRFKPPPQVEKAYEIWAKAIERRGKDVHEKPDGSASIPDPRPNIPTQWDWLYSGITPWQHLFFLKELEYFPHDYKNLPVSQYELRVVRGHYEKKAIQLKGEYDASKDQLLKLQLLWTSRLLHRIYEYIMGMDSDLETNMLNIPLSEFDKDIIRLQLEHNLENIFDRWKEIPGNQEALQRIMSSKPPPTPMYGLLIGKLQGVSSDARRMFMINIGCPEYAYYNEEFWDVDKILSKWNEYQTKKERRILQGNHTIRVEQQRIIQDLMERISKRFIRVKEAYQEHLDSERKKDEQRRKDEEKEEQRRKDEEKERTIKAFHAREKAFKEEREDEIKHKIEQHKNQQKPRYRHRNRGPKLPGIDEDKEMQKRLAQLQAKLEAFKISLEKTRLT